MACPRLSIDWGTAFPKPLLTPYEVTKSFGTPWGLVDFDLVPLRAESEVCGTLLAGQVP